MLALLWWWSSLMPTMTMTMTMQSSVKELGHKANCEYDLDDGPSIVIYMTVIQKV
jgi:hypothetical protein